MFISDLHIHTRLSIDGTESVDAMCAAAVKNRLGAIAITDHWDGFPPGMKDAGYAPHFMDARDFYKLHEQEFLSELAAAREKYKGSLRIVYGIEFGQPQMNLPETRELLDSRNFDFILASEHLCGEYIDYYALDYDKVNIDELMRECLALELEVVRSGFADSLAHIDQPVRRMEKTEFDVSLMDYRDEIAELLREMVNRGIALEINTHGLRNWYRRVSPPEWALRLYYDLGGRLVTLGSDAHNVRDVGAGIMDAVVMAKNIGLIPVSYYERHNPVIIND